jgi:hypothetical protein
MKAIESILPADVMNELREAADRAAKGVRDLHVKGYWATWVSLERPTYNCVAKPSTDSGFWAGLRTQDAKRSGWQPGSFCRRNSLMHNWLKK